MSDGKRMKVSPCKCFILNGRPPRGFYWQAVGRVSDSSLFFREAHVVELRLDAAWAGLGQLLSYLQEHLLILKDLRQTCHFLNKLTKCYVDICVELHFGRDASVELPLLYPEDHVPLTDKAGDEMTLILSRQSCVRIGVRVKSVWSCRYSWSRNGGRISKPSGLFSRLIWSVCGDLSCGPFTVSEKWFGWLISVFLCIYYPVHTLFLCVIVPLLCSSLDSWTYQSYLVC